MSCRYRLVSLTGSILKAAVPANRRCFSLSRSRQTDGVFGELTAMRTRTPFVDAFRKQQQEQQDGVVSTTPKPAARPDVTPKRMKDSYHSVVSHVLLNALKDGADFSRSYP